MNRREYATNLRVNSRKISKIVIDPHYEEKHGDSISDEIVVQLVQQLNEREFEVESTDGTYEYYVTDDLILEDKVYKLIWLLEENEIYIGIINCYRRRN